jgi:hypothetical protein
MPATVAVPTRETDVRQTTSLAPFQTEIAFALALNFTLLHDREPVMQSAPARVEPHRVRN